MARAAGRERTVCESCELPYYADGDGCPYCDYVVNGDEGDASKEGEAESEFVFGAAEPAEDSAAMSDRDASDGLVGRLKRALGL